MTFHFGGLLDDPAERFTVGSSKFLRKLDYASPTDVDDRVICDFIEQALGRYDYFTEHWKDLR